MTEAALRALLPRYGLDRDAPLRLLNRSENDTWLAGDGMLVLRQHRPGYHTQAEIASELDWLAALHIVPRLACVRPRPARDGRLIQIAEGRAVVGFDWIDGVELDPANDLRAAFGKLGAMAARLHDHARHWVRPAGFARKSWDLTTILGPQAHWGDWRAGIGLQPAGEKVLARAASRLEQVLGQAGTGPDCFGLIHADLRLANVLQTSKGLVAIDFDDCGFGWWMFDFAAAVSFYETDPAIPDLAASWLAGYRSVAPLPVAQAALIPALVVLRRLQLIAWLSSRAGCDTADTFGGAAFTHGSVDLAESWLGQAFLDDVAR